MTTSEQLEEEAILIAKYMELPIVKAFDTIPSIYYINGLTSISSSKFHSEWEWIMPVVEKIVQTSFGDGDNCYLRTFGMISQRTGEYIVRFNRHRDHMSPTLIMATYLAVVEFIKTQKEHERDT